MPMQPACGGLPGQLTEFLPEDFLVLDGYVLGAEEDDAALGDEDGEIADFVVRGEDAA